MNHQELPAALRGFVATLDALDRPATIEELRELLMALSIAREDLAPFIRFNDTCYARNPVVGNEHFELLCICWKSGQSSLIHDHVGSACGVRVVIGELTETIFEVIDGPLVRPRRVNHYGAGYVCSSVDRDVHQITNHQLGGAELITLHVYSPPLATMNTYSTFESVELQESAIR
jgi:cysteine dioxygenase